MLSTYFLMNSSFLVLKTESNSRIDHGDEVQTEDHGEDVNWFEVEIGLIIESILDTYNVVNELVDCVLLSDGYSWSSKEV